MPVLDALLALACVLLTSYLGIGLFGLPSPIPLTLWPLTGIVSALACRRWWLTGTIAGLGTFGGSLLGAARLAADSGVSLNLPVYVIGSVLAAGMGALAATILVHRADLEPPVAWIGVALVVVAVCQYGWFNASLPTGSATGVTAAALFDSTPGMSAGITDDAIFVLAVRRMNAGAGYYSAMGRTLADVNASRPVGGNNLKDPASYRMPTLYQVLAALNQGWQSWVVVMLALISAAVVAAWSIAARYASLAVALTGTTVTGAYLAGFTGINLPQTELWAGPLGLIAVALALKSLSVRRHALTWACSAAVVALLATITRELAVAFLFLGLGSTLVPDRWRSRRLWIPWAVATAVALVAYVAHVQAVATVAQTLPQELIHRPTLSRFDPTGRGLLSAVNDMAGYAWWTLSSAWIIWALGTVGGALAPRDLPRVLLLGGVSVGGAMTLFVLHPNGPLQNGMVPGYWGYVVLPTVVACAPLAIARLPLSGRPSAS